MAPAIDLEHGVAQLAGRVDQPNPAGQGIDKMSSATVDCCAHEEHTIMVAEGGAVVITAPA